MEGGGGVAASWEGRCAQTHTLTHCLDLASIRTSDTHTGTQAGCGADIYHDGRVVRASGKPVLRAFWRQEVKKRGWW